MGISCRGIMSLPYANQFRLLAGESGLSNEVQWVHSLEDPRYAQWLKGGELIILTGVVTGDDPAKLRTLFLKLHEQQAAGVVVSLSAFIPQVPRELFSLCDDLGLPLFQVPAQVCIIDISQSICRSILRERRRWDETEGILRDLLHSKRLSDQRLARLERVGLAQARGLRVVRVQIEAYHRAEAARSAPDLHGVPFYEEEQEEAYLDELSALLREGLKRQTERCFMTTEGGAVLWVAEGLSGEALRSVLAGLLDLLSARLPGMEVRVGVSEEFSEIRALRRFAVQAQDALQLSSHQEQPPSVSFYEDMVLFQLLQMAQPQEALGRMAERLLKDLPEQTALLETLACYIKNDCSAKRTAEEMFLHANTLHYRLRKIETLLGRDLDRAEDRFDVMLGLKLYEYQREKYRD